MPKKSNKQRKHKTRKHKTRKQKLVMMVGCSKKNKKLFSSLRNKSCPNCGPNCKCGSNCICPKNCSGNCYNKKGGSGCGSSGCPISPLAFNKYGGNSTGPILGIAQNGGICSSCGLQSGGAIPGPFVGGPLGPNNLPGQNGVGSDSNYLSRYNTNNDPALQMTQNATGYNTMNSKVGGYNYKKKGGGLIPQDLVNLGRDFGYNFKSAYNAINGYKAPVDPAPYKGQL